MASENPGASERPSCFSTPNLLKSEKSTMNTSPEQGNRFWFSAFTSSELSVTAPHEAEVINSLSRFGPVRPRSIFQSIRIFRCTCLQNNKT